MIGMAAVILVWEEKESLTCELCWVTSLALRGWRTSPGSVWLAGMGAALLSCRNGDILSALKKLHQIVSANTLTEV